MVAGVVLNANHHFIKIKKGMNYVLNVVFVMRENIDLIVEIHQKVNVFKILVLVQMALLPLVQHVQLMAQIYVHLVIPVFINVAIIV